MAFFYSAIANVTLRYYERYNVPVCIHKYIGLPSMDCMGGEISSTAFRIDIIIIRLFRDLYIIHPFLQIVVCLSVFIQ